MLSRPVRDAAAFVAVPSVMFGAIEVLVPLRIDALGGGHGVIAAGFIAGAGLEAVLAPLAGRYSDRVGRRNPYVVGLSICAARDGRVAVAQTLGGVLAALIATSLGAGLCFAPALTLLSDVAEASSLHQGFAAGLSNMAWASGQVVGGIGGGVDRQPDRQRGAERGDRRPAAADGRLRAADDGAGHRAAAGGRLGRWRAARSGAGRNWAGDQTCRPARDPRPGEPR